MNTNNTTNNNNNNNIITTYTTDISIGIDTTTNDIMVSDNTIDNKQP